MVNRYAVIDNPSGYVWGVVNADSPLDACNRIDAEVGGEARTYEE